MNIDLEKINKLANPFVIFEHDVQDLAPYILSTSNKQDNAVRVIRGNKCQTKQDLFNEISAALQFPYYFGENWDALDECINDLYEWLSALNYFLIFTNSEQLLSSESNEDFDILIRILERSKKAWKSGENYKRSTQSREKEIGFAVVFQFTNLNDSNNFSKWLHKVNLPKI